MVRKDIVGHLPQNIYKEIYASVPTLCVDLLVIYNNRFLLHRRVNEPAKGEWFFPGGRVYKNETLENAVRRKAKEELGIDIDNAEVKFLTVGETMFDDTELGGSIHSINITYIVKYEKKPEIILDKTQATEFNWFLKVGIESPLYVKNILKKAGFK